MDTSPPSSPLSPAVSGESARRDDEKAAMKVEQAPAPLRLRCGDGEEVEMDARRLAALFPAAVYSVPAFDSIAVFNLVGVYRKMEARGWHASPLVERTFIRTVGDHRTLISVASAARRLGMQNLLNLCLRVMVELFKRTMPADIQTQAVVLQHHVAQLKVDKRKRDDADEEPEDSSKKRKDDATE